MYQPPFKCGQEIAWPAGKGNLLTWRGPNQQGLYAVTVRDSTSPRLVTVHSPGFGAPASRNSEIRRYD